ncbi:MAG TPA: TonB-dependent receptor, partial [Polyangiaceae bacterium]
HRVDLRYDHRLGSRGSMRSAVTIGLDRSLLQDQERSVRDRMASARTELEYRASRDVLVRAGTDLALDTYDVTIGTNDLSPTAARASEFFPSRTDVAAGVRGDLVIDLDSRFTLTPGVRVDLYGSQGVAALAVDPRLAWRAELGQRLALLGALGIAHQPPSFVVPLPGFQPGGLRGGLQRSIQESFGVEFDLGQGTIATATVFQNAFFQMSDPLGALEPIVNGCAPGQYPTGSIGGDLGEQPDEPSFCGARFEPGTLGPDRSGGGGQAADSRGGRRIGRAFEARTLGSSRGFELYFKRRLTARLGGFLSYTLSRSTRSYENRSYVASFDRTHVANAAIVYELGRRWRVGTRLVFYTGLPKAPDPTDPDSTRLPAFFRADLRLEKRWQLGETSWISFVAEWMNATLSKEAVTTTCTLEGCEAETIGPVTIPSLGVEGGF